MKETNIISKLWQPRKGKRFQALILCLAVMMLLIPANLFGAGENDIERLFGDNRYETMYQIALKISPGMVNNVVLTSGDGFADALAGVPFAHQKYAPILLVEKNPKETSKAIQYVKDHLRVNGKVYILGGTAVVSDQCEKVLAAIGIKAEGIVRIAGSNRYETSVQIAQNMTHDGAEYYLVSGENFPDALSASVLAAITNFYSADETAYLKSKGKTVQTSRGGVPIILVPSKGQIPAATIQYLNSSYKLSGKQKFHIIGGTGAVSETAVNQLKEQVTQTTAENIVRLSGTDRYDTNKNLVLQQGVFDSSWVNSGQSLPISLVVLASGQNYPDALSGAVLAASVKAPLVLINNNLPAATSETLLSFKQKNGTNQTMTTTMTVLGGAGVISQDTVTAADYLFNYGKRPGGSKVGVFAGSGSLGSKNGAKDEAEFCFPFAAIEASNGDVYISDTNNHLIRVVNANGTVATYAGKIGQLDDYGMPVGGLSNGSRLQARFNAPKGLTLDSTGNLYIADSGNGAIRKINTQGVVSTVVEGLSLPSDLVLAKDGKLIVSETLKHRILKVNTDGTYEVLAGGNYQEKDGYLEGAWADGQGEAAKFNEPVGLAIAADGTIYVADSGNQRIRAISPEGNVTTVAGSGNEKLADTTYLIGDFQDGSATTAAFNFPMGLTLAANGTLYVADSYNHAIRTIVNNEVKTLTGKGLHGKQNGYLEQALFDGPCSIRFLKNGNLLVVDQLNHMVRVVEFK